MTLFQPFLTFSTEVAVVSPGGYEDRRARPALQYSAVTTTETRLPDGMRPLSLIANRTGLLFVGDLVSSHPSEAERTVQLVEALARAARRDIPARVVLNRVKRTTTLARHAVTEITAAGLPRIEAALSDLVAFGELTYSGRLPDTGPAVAEVAALVAELRGLGWLPYVATSSRSDVMP